MAWVKYWLWRLLVAVWQGRTCAGCGYVSSLTERRWTFIDPPPAGRPVFLCDPCGEKQLMQDLKTAGYIR